MHEEDTVDFFEKSSCFCSNYRVPKANYLPKLSHKIKNRHEGRFRISARKEQHQFDFQKAFYVKIYDLSLELLEYSRG
jgi:hypothetical protein